jgi:DNA repair protein RadA/Sms
MVEELIAPPSKSVHAVGRGLTGASTPRRLTEIEGMLMSVGHSPLANSRGVGGGVVPGSIVLVGGDPGIGKSTLLLQVALEMAMYWFSALRFRRESERHQDAPCVCSR